MKLLYTILDTTTCNILIASNYKEIINLWINDRRHKLLIAGSKVAEGELQTPKLSMEDFKDLDTREYQLDTVSAAVNNPAVTSGLEYRNKGYILSVH